MRRRAAGAIIQEMLRTDPDDRCHHDHPPDECPICSDEEFAYPELDPLGLLPERAPEDAVVHADIVGVPFS